MKTRRPRGGALASLMIIGMGMGMLPAQTIDLPNGSFESPVTTFADPRIDSWQKTPKPDWYDESGGYSWDQLTGVFANTPAGSPDSIENVDGKQAIFLFAVPQVGLFQDYHSTDWTNSIPTHAFQTKFEVGKSYRLSVGVVGGGGGMKEGVSVLLGLYYLDAATNRVTVATNLVIYTKASFPTNTHLVDYHVEVPQVKATDPWAGQYLGVQMVSAVSPDLVGGYWDLDNVRLTAVGGPVFSLGYAREGTDLRISWPSVTGHQYQMRVSSDLKSWSDFEAPLVGTGGELSKLLPLTDRAQASCAVLASPIP